jgi:cysteinyl-tRNA synthetase
MQKLRDIEKSNTISDATKYEIFSKADQLLGLDLLKAPAPKRAANAQQLELLDLRAKARGAGDYAESDRLRDLLKVEGIEVRDNSDGQSWSWLI